MSEPSEYDRHAQAWVAQKYGVVPDLGSVTFENDCAAYASGGWAKFDVSWTAGGVFGFRTLSESAWQYDLSDVLRELFDATPLDGSA